MGMRAWLLEPVPVTKCLLHILRDNGQAYFRRLKEKEGRQGTAEARAPPDTELVGPTRV